GVPCGSKREASSVCPSSASSVSVRGILSAAGWLSEAFCCSGILSLTVLKLGSAQSARGLKARLAIPYSSELHDDGIDRQTVARLRLDLGDRNVAVDLQHILHLHGLDNRKRLTCLYLLAFGNRNGNDEAWHGAEQLFRGVGRLFLGHEVFKLSLALGIDVG